jgi:hypothetical protein
MTTAPGYGELLLKKDLNVPESVCRMNGNADKRGKLKACGGKCTYRSRVSLSLVLHLLIEGTTRYYAASYKAWDLAITHGDVQRSLNWVVVMNGLRKTQEIKLFWGEEVLMCTRKKSSERNKQALGHSYTCWHLKLRYWKSVLRFMES